MAHVYKQAKRQSQTVEQLKLDLLQMWETQVSSNPSRRHCQLPQVAHGETPLSQGPFINTANTCIAIKCYRVINSSDNNNVYGDTDQPMSTVCLRARAKERATLSLPGLHSRPPALASAHHEPLSRCGA